MELENAKLKRMYADQALEIAAIKEVLNRKPYREEVPSAHLFESIAEVQEITDDSLKRYNEIRPHDALGSLPRARNREKLLAHAMSTLELST
jgi:transposase InsO family protein